MIFFPSKSLHTNQEAGASCLRCLGFEHPQPPTQPAAVVRMHFHPGWEHVMGDAQGASQSAGFKWRLQNRPGIINTALCHGWTHASHPSRTSQLGGHFWIWWWKNRTRSYHNLTLKTLGRFYMPPPLESSSSMDVGSIVSHWRETWVPSVLQAVLYLYCAWAWKKCQTRQPSSSLHRWELLAVLLVVREKARWFSSKVSIATFCFVFVFFKFCFSLNTCIIFW